jgi:2-iminobutanoate/2-iminopropanoate deaminase
MVLKIERFQPEGMNVRMAGGKPFYSHVVTASGSGKIVYTAGQLARDIDGNCVGKGDMRAQMEQTFQNLDRCLKAAGATWADVVKTNTFVTDFDEFQKCADIRMRYLGVATPTSTTVGVTRLAGRGRRRRQFLRSGSGPTPVQRPGYLGIEFERRYKRHSARMLPSRHRRSRCLAGRNASGCYTGTPLWPMPPRRAPASMARHSTSWPAGRARLFGIDSHSRNSSRSWPWSSSSKAERAW